MIELCERCGGTIAPDAAGAATLLRAIKTIRGRKLAVPDQALEDIRRVAESLRCRAGLCCPEEGA